MHFHDLNLKKVLLEAVETQGFETPTVIQASAFSVIMSGSDTVGLAQTGTGKTLAYLLPLLNLWKFSKEPHPQVLILVPTRELVAQVVEECEKLTERMNCITVGVYGGANINTQTAQVLQGLDILVGTPGRVLDLAANGSLQLKHCKKVVIDEVDECLSLGFRSQLLRIFEYLPEKRQNLLFSATLSEEVEAFIHSYYTDPKFVEAARPGTPLEQIEQQVYHLPNFTTKVNLLKHLMIDESFNKVLIFTSSRVQADRLFEEIAQEENDKIAVIHSNKAQNTRFAAVNNFESGATQFLIATDVIARGIDVSEVSHVINFDIPENPETYIHRIGRTGRAGKKGIAINLVGTRDENNFEGIETFIQQKLPVSAIPSEVEYSELVLEFEKEVVAMKNTLTKQNLNEAGPAFHDKKAKNKKVNVRYDHKKAMMDKYGKPKTRGSKKKKK